MSNIAEILDGTDEAEMYELIIDPIWDKSYDGTRIDLLSEAERNLLHSQILQDSINGGGINTMFYNNSSKIAFNGLSAFRAIGEPTAIRIIEEALDAFPGEAIPEDLEACRQFMESWPDDNPTDDKWNELSNEFYENDENLLSASIEYVRRNRAQF